MADRPDTIQITLTERPQCDWQFASQFVNCLDGRVVVEMAPFSGKRGELYLPDEVAANLRPDIGTVIVTGEDIAPWLSVGSTVCVRPYDGTIRVDFESGDYKPAAEVRFYGVYVPEDGMGNPISCPWYDSILATLDDDMNITPTKNRILVKRDPVIEEDRGVLMIEDLKFRTNAGTVIAVGPGTYRNDGSFKDVKVKPGDRVVYHPIGMVDFDLTAITGDSDLCIMPEDSIEAILPSCAVVTGIRQKNLTAV